MSQPPIPKHTYLIINRKLDLAWDLSHLENFVVGTKLEGKPSQQWFFEKDGEYWIIQNSASKEFATIKRDSPVKPGVPVVTANPRKWTVRFEEQLGGWRIINPESKLNAEIGLLGHPLPDPPVVLGEQSEAENQIWILLAAKNNGR